ncbi:hypothetical protein NE686_17945 [Tissierella carlieri]|uniref:Uncharacterized protein n=1 Tax=Tissierella carlieri TaxID=689904 RepID=A0ABT1SES3_9FIRM|nr:hypothetical protein [Tissierella carlieri]MCQ4924988.1 hypothetical protein [Tissierella carlieri]
MFGDGSNRVKAYIYNSEGKYSPPIYISVDPIQIASFIMITQSAPKIVITDISDNFELDTMYGFVNRCADQKFLDELLGVLIPMQEGKTSPNKLNILSWGVSEEHNRDSIMIPFIKENFGIDL